MALLCENCNAPIDTGEAFCSECGTRAKQPTARPLSAQPPAVSDRVCPRCGELNPKSEPFCSRCGAPETPQQAAPVHPVEPSPRRKGLPIGRIIGAVCVAVFTLFVFVQTGQKRQEEARLQASLRQAEEQARARIVIPPLSPTTGQSAIEPSAPYTENQGSSTDAPQAFPPTYSPNLGGQQSSYPDAAESMRTQQEQLRRQNEQQRAQQEQLRRQMNAQQEQMNAQNEQIARQACDNWHRQWESLNNQQNQLNRQKFDRMSEHMRTNEIDDQLEAVHEQIQRLGSPPVGCAR